MRLGFTPPPHPTCLHGGPGVVDDVIKGVTDAEVRQGSGDVGRTAGGVVPRAARHRERKSVRELKIMSF